MPIHQQIIYSFPISNQYYSHINNEPTASVAEFTQRFPHLHILSTVVPVPHFINQPILAPSSCMASCTAPHGRDHLTNFGDQEPRKEGLGALDGYQDQSSK